MQRREFQHKLDALIAEAQAAGMIPLEVSLVLQETYLEIDDGTVLALSPDERIRRNQ